MTLINPAGSTPSRLPPHPVFATAAVVPPDGVVRHSDNMHTLSTPTPTPTRPGLTTVRCGHAAIRGSAMFALAVVFGGCAAERPADRMVTTTETLPNGATLVRHTPPPAGVPVTWRLDEELRIGTMGGGGPAQFGRVGGIAVVEDGRIAVLDAQAQDIRVFDADGRHLRTLGRKGGGPGEMAGANGIVVGPDGLLRVLDGRNARISYFDLDTGFVRSHPYNPVSISWLWEGVLDEEAILWATHFIPSNQPGERGRSAYVGYDSAGIATDTLPHPRGGVDPSRDQPGVWAATRATPSGGRVTTATINVPFYSRAQHILDRRLRFWSTADGDPVYRLERRSPNGGPTLVIETERPLQPVQPEDRASADSLASSLEQRWDTKFDRSKIPDVAPAIISFFMDDDTRLWVLARTPDSDSTRTFDVYDGEEGRWLGTLATELSIMPHPRPVIRGHQVWAVVRDELDVSYVVRGRVEPGVGTPIE